MVGVGGLDPPVGGLYSLHSTADEELVVLRSRVRQWGGAGRVSLMSTVPCVCVSSPRDCLLASPRRAWPPLTSGGRHEDC